MLATGSVPSKAGRPSEYGPHVIEAAEAYIQQCRDSYESVPYGDKNIVRFKVKLPSIEGLALALGITRDTVYDWEKHHKDFSYTVSKLRHLQVERLIDNGLAGTYRADIVKLILSRHGYVEKTQQDLTTQGKPINDVRDISDIDLADRIKQILQAGTDTPTG